MIDRQMQRAADLLAVIHRDDGSYTADHGWERSCADAARKVCQLRVDLDNARAMLREALSGLASYSPADERLQMRIRDAIGDAP